MDSIIGSSMIHRYTHLVGRLHSSLNFYSIKFAQYANYFVFFFFWGGSSVLSILYYIVKLVVFFSFFNLSIYDFRFYK